MKHLCLLLVLFSTAHATDFFIAPTGTSSGNGSAASPWNLGTGLTATGIVKPGDTVWIRGGTYTGDYICTLLGSPSAPIIVRNYQNERVIIDGRGVIYTPTFKVANGGYVWIWGLEIMNSDPNRWSTLPGSNPPTSRPLGADIGAPGVKLINCIIYDTGEGISAWSSAPNFEAYGNVIFNNGWESTDRGHGHGIYTQNDTGTKLFKNNVVLHQFGNGVNFYGSSAAYLRNITFDGNSFLNSRQVYGGNTPTENFAYINNRSYNTAPQFGYGTPSAGLLAENNYLARGLFLQEYTGGVTIQKNTIYEQIHDGQAKLVSISLPAGTTLAAYNFDYNTYYQSSQSGSDFYIPGVGMTFSGWQKQGQDLHGAYLPTAGPNYRPTGLKVFFTKNQYDPQKATLTVFNWDRLNTIAVDPSSVLSPGDRFELRNSEDYFGDVITGTYAGGSLSIPMTGHTLALPIGYSTPLGPTGFPEFGVFLLNKVTSASAVSISGLQTASVGPTSATVQWTTNVAANSQVDYGTTAAYGNSVPLDPLMVTSHSEPLSSLRDGTTYHYRVTSTDAKGNFAVSADQVFTTPDITPPVISAVVASAITSSGATINWTTNEPADSQVEYGPTASYGSLTTLNSALATTHQVSLSGLSGTVVYYRVRSRDSSGNLTLSPGFSFALPTLTISGLQATATSATTAVITWTTNLASDSQVDYGPTTAYGTTTPLNTTLVTSHSVTLSALSGASFYFRVNSKTATLAASAAGGPVALATATAVTVRIPVLKSDGRISFFGATNSGCTQTTWNAAWSAASAEVNDTNAIRSNFVASGCIGSQSIGIARGFLAFDTRTIPAAAQIVSAKLLLYVTGKIDDVNDGSDFVSVVQGLQASPTTLAPTDYTKAGDKLQAPTEGSARIDIGAIPLNAYTGWNLNAAGLAWVVKGGYTTLAVREGHDLLNKWPGFASGKGDGLTVVMSESNNSAQSPYLEITYK